MIDLARMSTSVPDRAKYLLLAVYYIEQMWSLTVHAVNTASAEKVCLWLWGVVRAGRSGVPAVVIVWACCGCICWRDT